MDTSNYRPPYYNLILLLIFASLFFYFLYELFQQENPWLNGAFLLLCGIFAISNYVRWNQKLKKHIQ